MVSAEELNELFEYRDGFLYGKCTPWRSKSANTKVVGKKLDYNGSKYKKVSFTDKSGKNHQMCTHRVIFCMHHGYYPKEVDHINRDKFDNRIENLREVVGNLNYQNRGPTKDTKWGMRGLHKDKWGNFQVYINHLGKRYKLGYTPCLGEAWRLRANAEAKHWPNARPNEVSPFRGTKGVIQQN